MDIFQSIVAAQVIFVFGLINLVSGVLVLLTCRCIPGAKITGGLMRYSIYKSFFRYHCYIWWIFWVSVIVHAVFALALLGVPF